MQKVYLPYGRTRMSVEIDERNLVGVFESPIPQAAIDPIAEVENALDNPIGSLPLEELARGKKSVLIIASDHTRPVPSKILMPAMLKRLRKFNPEIDVTILIATGCHRETSRAELVDKFGETIVDSEKILVHDSRNESMYHYLGKLPSGGNLIVNRLAIETDLLISEGFIEPHFFAGFSGGRKSVLPGVAAKETVLANHCAEFINSPFARTGNLKHNPIHEDMLFAAKKANLAFIVNVVINGEKKIVKAFAGDAEKAHSAGCEFLKSCCGVAIPEVDIVITSNGGYPLDQNVYQCVKGMTAGEAVCREKGVIILCAACNDGHGGEAFYKTLSQSDSPRKLLESISSVPRNQTKVDQWQYQILARILDKFQVIMVTKDCPHEMIRDMKMSVASTLDDALKLAYSMVGSDARVAVIPDGVSVIVEKK
ncbi:MAG: nickel-dependent lactate racemase [Lentisphaeria bacterium]|nr:nickel-dependent lactate racemase [Lentisphaeria bacterium]